MKLLKRDKSKKSESKPVDKSVYASNVRIDKSGVQWKKESYWLKQELLGKLKVVAHFENTTIPKLVHQALEEYVINKFEGSVAIRKLIGRQTGKIIKGRS